MISKGMLGEAKNNAAWNVDQLAEYAEKGVPIVGLEPSCLLTLRDEYPEFLRTNEAKRVSESSFLLEEFLMRELNAGKLSLNFRSHGRKALLHGHCHQKALVGTAPTVAVLKSAGFERQRSRFGLLRHGRLLRLRKRALRSIADDRQSPPGSGGQRGER